MFLSGERLLSVAIVAKRLNKDTSTIYGWLRNGKLKGVKTSSVSWAIRESHYSEYLQKLSEMIF